MKLSSIWVALLILAAGAADSLADRWLPPEPRSFESQNRRFIFRTKPKDKSEPLVALGTLWAKRGADAPEEKVWETDLVNVPYFAFVSDIGQVVTVDTHYKKGYEHSLVVYNTKGKVLADFSDDKFLSKDEIDTKAWYSATSRLWSLNAKLGFDAKQEQFVATLRWGKVVRVSMDTGKLVTE
jgi:hypothetical protein